MSESNMAGQTQWLRRMTEILTWDAKEQLDYLRDLGADGVVDELALQFDDSFHVLKELRLNDLVSKDAEVSLNAVAAQLTEMSGADLWSPSSLREAPEWQKVRLLASKALALL